MAESGKRHTRSAQQGRTRSEAGTQSRGARPGGAPSHELLRLAEDLEEHGREILSRARDLRRLAEGKRAPRERSAGTDDGGGARGARSRERGSGRPEGRERGGKGARDAGAGARPKRGGDQTPEWAPGSRRRGQ